MNPLTLTCATLIAASASLAAQDPVDETATETEDVVEVDAPSLVLEDVMMLRLRDGAIHWGSISDHDPDGFRFALLTHGGLVDVPWTLLDPSQEISLRERFGYVEVSSEEYMVDVEVLRLMDGREVMGVVLSREGDHFVLKVDGNLQMVPKARVQSISKGQRMPALDVYGREELYAMFAARAAEDDPEAQLELARMCERILDFGHALEHYARVLELDPDSDRSEVEFAMERAQVKALQQAQIDYLREVDHLRKRGKYDEALVLVEVFAETFPDSPLQQDALKSRDRVLLARDEALRDLVRRRWHKHMGRLCRSKGAKMSFAEAVTYAEEGLGQEIQAQVLADVQKQISETVEPEAILAFWATRNKLRYKVASYGLGTWLLGEDRALDEGEDRRDAREKKPVSAKDAQRQALEEKMKRFLESQAAARRSRSRADQQDEMETAWAVLGNNPRAQWVLAYYVEFSGDLELRGHPSLRNCASCGGRGVHEIIHAGPATSKGMRQSGGKSGGVQLLPCSVCKGIGRVRRVYYR